MELNDPALLDLKQVADKLSPPPKLTAAPHIVDGVPVPPPGHIICGAFKDGCHGNGFIPIPEIRMVTSSLDLGTGQPMLVTLRDNLCGACRKQAGNAAMLACINCRCIVTRFKPFNDPTGFKFLPGQVYHCNICFHCLEEEAKRRANDTGKPFETCLLEVAGEEALKEGKPAPIDVTKISATVLEKEVHDRSNRNHKIYVGSH